VAGQIKRVSAPPADIVGAMSFWSATRWRQHLVLAHPTDRAVLLLEESAGWALPVLEMNAAHRDAYLEPWTRYASPERLRGTFDLAQRLAPLCFAITFRLDVLPMLHASWELREFVPFFLRRLITAWAGQTG
jgi:hypothetical protein